MIDEKEEERLGELCLVDPVSGELCVDKEENFQNTDPPSYAKVSGLH